jgi:hypothetical protein
MNNWKKIPLILAMLPKNSEELMGFFIIYILFFVLGFLELLSFKSLLLYIVLNLNYIF